METGLKPGIMRGYGRPLSVKNTHLTVNSGGSGLIFVQIYVFGDNPLKYTDPDGNEIKAFTSFHKMNTGDWKDEPVGNSSNVEANFMRKIGCAVTGLANAINTLLGTNMNPSDINKAQYFPETGSDSVRSDIYFDQVSSDNGLSHTVVNNNFKERLADLKGDSKINAILAFVKYSNSSGAGHYVGVNETVNINGVDYIEISPTSSNDTNANARKSSWLFSGNKTYVPLSDIKRLDVLTK
jgi:hypothetical protein